MTVPELLWQTASTGISDDARRTVLVCTRSRWQKARFLLRSRCAAVAILAAMNLVGCSGATPLSAPPIIVGAVMCPEPATPSLPSLDGGSTFDAPAAWATLMERDDALRGYIAALRRTVACYAAQIAQTANPVD